MDGISFLYGIIVGVILPPLSVWIHQKLSDLK